MFLVKLHANTSIEMIMMCGHYTNNWNNAESVLSSGVGH